MFICLLQYSVYEIKSLYSSLLPYIKANKSRLINFVYKEV
jgi:hypothetical protein